MNVRKPIDYGAMFAALDILMAATIPQMELYYEIGKLVSARPEKGAAVATAEYLANTYPDASGFSPRNLRRMREFYRAYESAPEVLAQAMTIGWTQNTVILEAKLTLPEQAWYIRAARRFGWSKLELQRKIAAKIHLEITLDSVGEVCYTEEQNTSVECAANDKNPICVPRQYLQEPHGRVCDEGPCKKGGIGGPIPNCLRRHQHRGNRKSGLPSRPPEAGGAWDQLHRKTARQLTKTDFAQYDLLIGMDRVNIRNMNRICGGDPDGKIKLLLSYTDRPGDVAGPWYTGDFDAAWRGVLKGCQELLASIVNQ